MKNIGTETIETERLILRKYEINDAIDMYNNWATDEEVTKYLTWYPHKNIEETKEIISSWISKYEKPCFFNWIVWSKETLEAIGSIEVVKVSEESNFGEIGYCYARKCWGRGIATEALKAVLEYLFTQADFRIIEIRYLEHNPASGRVMVKAGLKKEAVLRERDVDKEGIINDIIVYSITKKEWEDLK